MSNTNGNRIYRFDAQMFDVKLNVQIPELEDEQPIYVYYRLRKPLVSELVRWTHSQALQSQTVNAKESKYKNPTDEVTIEIARSLVVATRGYDFGDGPTEDFVNVTDDVRAELKPNHLLSAFKDGLYTISSTIKTNPGNSFSGIHWGIQQKIGPSWDRYIIDYKFREPSERELKIFRGNNMPMSVQKGERPIIKVTPSLPPNIELFDAIVEDVQGGFVGSEPFTLANKPIYLQHIDPILKRDATRTFMEGYDKAMGD
jgi:hypothetical protein